MGLVILGWGDGGEGRRGCFWVDGVMLADGSGFLRVLRGKNILIELPLTYACLVMAVHFCLRVGECIAALFQRHLARSSPTFMHRSEASLANSLLVRGALKLTVNSLYALSCHLEQHCANWSSVQWDRRPAN